MDGCYQKAPSNPLRPTQIIAARWVFPIVGEPIHRGWVRLAGEEVLEVGSGKPPTGTIDLGDVALLPGLVNAHAHLEFSDCQTPIGHPGIALSDWIGAVIAARSGTTPATKQQAIQAGLQESSAAGVRLLGEITTPPTDYPASLGPVELIPFGEVLGLSPERSTERINAASEHLATHAAAGLSPHAPYSTTLDTVHRCVDLARTGNRPLAMHVAESPAERELIDRGSGPFARVLQQLGLWRDGLFPWPESGFVNLIEILAAAPRALLIHGNDLQSDEIERLAKHDHLSVVYCPRTHAYFGYQSHPVAKLLASGIRVALGTDSRASNPDLHLWKEAQHLWNHRQDLSPHDVLAMATFSGAEALGRPTLGRIASGASPGFGIVATTAVRLEQIWADMADHAYEPIDLDESFGD